MSYKPATRQACIIPVDRKRKRPDYRDWVLHHAKNGAVLLTTGSLALLPERRDP